MRGGFFGALEGRFAGDFESGGEARMGGFAAEFRGFWTGRGCGAAIQRTAGARGEKIFKNLLERGEKPKNWGEGARRDLIMNYA